MPVPTDHAQGSIDVEKMDLPKVAQFLLKVKLNSNFLGNKMDLNIVKCNAHVFMEALQI